MRFLLMVQTPAGRPQPAADDGGLSAAMSDLVDEMAASGVLLDTAGLRPVDEGVRVRLSGGALTVVDGPFTESTEYLGGYCLLQARSAAEAQHWASRFLLLHQGDWDMTMEIRQLDEPA